ncbi:MAG TPA: Tex-like N-terminal domain-containing protein, partial [Bacteroidales bacterium]|nr:Tex-like N-terminal domain-containing protein [Bacteroidales bacterium]
MEKYIKIIADKLGIQQWQVENTIRLLDDGATVPFISRYRKEMTGSLDEVTILTIKDEFARLKELEKRREAVIRSVEEQEKMTPELLQRLNEAVTLSELEDIYLPYRPKRRTRATVARENGLEPLAVSIFKQHIPDPETEAGKYISEKVATTEEALAGACDIIAEWVSEDEKARKMLRGLFEKDAVIVSKVIKGKETDGNKFADYFEWSEPARRCPSHRMLAML